MLDWTIDPHVGVGPIRFGMSEAEVTEILGPPEHVRQTEARTEFRENGEGEHCIVIYRDGGVSEIDFEKTAKTLSLDGRKLFSGKRDALIDELIERTDTVFENFEGYVFPDLGLNMSNGENFRENPNICVFAAGVFDKNIAALIADGMGEFIKGGPA